VIETFNFEHNFDSERTQNESIDMDPNNLEQSSWNYCLECLYLLAFSDWLHAIVVYGIKGFIQEEIALGKTHQNTHVLNKYLWEG